MKLQIFDDAIKAFKEVATLLTSSGAASAGNVPHLDAQGRLDMSFMPNGLATPDTQVATATEALAAGDFVNIYDNAGTTSMRKALATDATKPCNGFVKASVSNGASGTAYCQGVNSVLNASVEGASASTKGKRIFLSATLAGQTTITPPSGAGQIMQAVGDCVGRDATYTYINFVPGDFFIRA